VSAGIKLELLGLIDGAVKEGWSHTGACRVLDLADSRAHHWRARLRETGTLEDRDPGGGAVHGILAWEEQAILELIERWGAVDRSDRSVAHRGSYIGSVFVSPFDGAARGAQAPGPAPRRAVSPATGHACISTGSLAEESDLDVGRDSLQRR
jgi:hypothetical protein